MAKESTSEAISQKYVYNGGYVPLSTTSNIIRPRDQSKIGEDDAPVGEAYTGALVSPSFYEPRAFSAARSFASVAMAHSAVRMAAGSVGASTTSVGGVVQSAPDLHPPEIEERDALPVPPRPLKVVHVGPFLLRGGAEQWLLDLIRATDQRYLRFTRCISTYHDLIDVGYVEALASLGVIVEAGGPESVQLAARDADVLISWGVELDPLLGDVRPRLSIQVVHGDGPMNRHFLERSRKSIDHAVAVSHGVLKRVCKGFPATVIYNGIDAARLAPRRSVRQMRRDLSISDDDFVVGFVGRFAPEKRPEIIVDAVAALPDRFHALFVGWGRLLTELRRRSQERLPRRHAFTHASNNLGDLYRAMDAVCLVSNQEGFPLVLLEAMLCRRPVVSTPVGCVPEIIEDRVNGIWTTGTPTDLANKLRQLAERPGWARGLAQEGFDSVEPFGYARRMARDYEYLLHTLWQRKAVLAS